MVFLSVPVGVPQRRTKSAVRRARVWAQAIRRLAAELHRRGIVDGTRFRKVPAAVGATDAWTVTRGGVPYRCIYQYTIVPSLDGDPFVGRVDVAYE